MKKTNLLLLLVIFLLGAGSALSQSSVDPGPFVNGPVVQSNGQSGEGIVKLNNLTNNQGNNLRDNALEVGETSVNKTTGIINAAGKYVAIPYNIAFEQNFDGSIEAWINPTIVSATQQIAHKGATSNFSFLFGITSPGNLYFRIGSAPVVNTGGTLILPNTWTHVAAVWTGGPSAFMISFYVNGVLSGAPVACSGTWLLATDSVKIGGGHPVFPSEFFQGKLEEVRFWNTPLTAAEIAANRFTVLGDWGGANTAFAITSGNAYAGLTASYPFNGTSTTYAWDDISGFNGYYRGGLIGEYALPGYPIPYNLALYCPGLGNFASFAPSAAYNQVAQGTMESWIFMTQQTTTHMICTKSPTASFNLFWGIRASIGNRQALCINSTQFQNDDGITIVPNRWTHVAASWTQSGANYIVDFFVNGKKSGTTKTLAATWNSSLDSLRIGAWNGGTANSFFGYIDEFRIWNKTSIADSVSKKMFVSARSLTTNPNLVFAVPFEGNLIKFGTGVVASQNLVGDVRFSGYVNETTTGAYSSNFEAHTSVLNAPVFGRGFTIKAINKPTENSLPAVKDTILISGYSGNVTSAQVFADIKHTWTADLSLTVTAPNGTSVILSNGNGSSSNGGYLTIFSDTATNLVTGTTLLTPWSNMVRPQNLMNTFGNSPVNGRWVFTVSDGAAGDSGMVVGWGIRFNYDLISGYQNISTEIPESFNVMQNYPNPFNPTTKIKFSIPSSLNTQLSVYDITGREIMIKNFGNIKAGTYEFDFNGAGLSSGVYFYKLTAGDNSKVMKMILMK